MDPISFAVGAAGVAVAIYSLSHQKRQSKAFEKMANSSSRIARSLEREVVTLRDRVASLEKKGVHDPAVVALETQKLEQKRRDAEWRKQRDIWKAVGWAAQNLGQED